jgi:hypothetical protein
MHFNSGQLCKIAKARETRSYRVYVMLRIVAKRFSIAKMASGSQDIRWRDYCVIASAQPGCGHVAATIILDHDNDGRRNYLQHVNSQNVG